MEDIKDLILDKTKQRSARFGFKKTTMDEISRDCKISKRTIYEHFKDKENLFTCLIIRETRKARAIILARAGDISDPLERLIHLIKTAIAYFKEDDFLTLLLRSNDELFPNFLSAKYHCIVEEEISSIIADIINEGKRQGMILQVDEKVVAYAGLKLIQAFSYMRTIEFCMEKEGGEDYTDVLFDLLVNAIIKGGIV